MAEYIEREAVKAVVKRQLGATELFEGIFNADIDAIPAADVAPVVRCRRCYAHGRCGAEKIYLGEGIEDPFCCRGARKDGNGE